MKHEDRERIGLLLERFYAGSTSREEELELYCRLEEQDDPSPFRDDLLLLKALLGVAESEEEGCERMDVRLSALIDGREEAARQRRSRSLFLHRGHYGAVACVAVALTMGAMLWLRPAGGMVSNRNGVPMSETEAAEETEEAMELLESCLNYAAEETEGAMEMLYRSVDEAWTEPAMREE